MVRLEPKTAEGVASWLTTLWTGYYEELIAAGFTPEDATANIERNEQSLFSAGLPNDDQHVLDIWHDDVVIGTLWLAQRGHSAASVEWYIYDVEIDETLRGQGLGRATMEAAEEYVKSRGATHLALNVFAHNTVARHLYESLGYVEQAVQMKKQVS